MGQRSGCIDYEDLAARIKSEERRAFTEFASLFGPSFRRYFLGCGMPSFEAEDLAATFVTDILLKVGQYHTMDGGGFQAWVYQSMRNMAADWGRKRKRTVPTVASDHGSSEWADPDGGGPAESSLDPEEVAAVREAWERLTDTDREIIEMRDLRNKPKWSEIAGELRIGEGAARVRHTRALRRLAETLQADPRIQREISIEAR